MQLLPHLLSILVGSATFLYSNTAAAQSKPDVYYAQAKKKPTKKKPIKKKKADDLAVDDFGPSDIDPIDSSESDMGMGVHREQEGVDTPYKAEASLRTDLSFLNVSVGDSDPAKNTIIDFGVEWLFIIGQMSFGPDIGFKSSTTPQTVQTADSANNTSTTSVIETTTSALSAGGLFKWNFANIDRSTLVPFAYAGAAYKANEEKTKGSKAVKSSGSALRIGGGLNLFIDSNIAFNPRIEYRLESDKGEAKEDSKETKTSGVKLQLGIAIFI